MKYDHAPGAVLILALVATGALADDLRGADRFLCSTQRATICLPEGECLVLAPADADIPQFIEVDAKARRLATTAASGVNRQTPASSVSRSDERIVMQGYEGGRAFSLLIQEPTGEATFAAVADDRSVIVFAACTPLPLK